MVPQANDGFLKIDLKKKSYSRGKRGMTGAKFKRAEYQRKVDAKEGRKVKEYKCYQCGEVGHMAYQVLAVYLTLVHYTD